MRHSIAMGIVIFSLYSMPARADGILNGLFSNGLEGWQYVGDVTGVSTNGYTYVRLQETFEATPDDPDDLRRPKASRSRLFQEFTVPADATDLSFRFRFAFSPRVRTTTVPADAFTAHLVTTNGTRVLPDAGDAPTFTNAFFYIDSDGRLVYDTAHVDVQMTPGPDGMFGVTLKELNSNGLIGQRLRLEFDLATADNGVTSAVFMDGIADGSPPTPYSGIVTAGVGAEHGPDTFTINVPGTVRQAYLYWSGEHASSNGDETVDVTVDGNTTGVTGTLIGGPEFFYTNNGSVYVSTYRADVASLIIPGQHTVGIGGLSFDRSSSGAGLVVLYNDGSAAHVETQYGQDLAFAYFDPPLDQTVPKPFTFAAADSARQASLHLFAASVGENRPNRIRVQVAGENPVDHDNLLSSTSGAEWDTLVLPVNIPADATSLTVELISLVDGSPNLPASMNWILAGLEMPLD